MQTKAANPRTTAERGAKALRVAGHFGEWLQGRIGPEGSLALVTVVCDPLAVEARRLGPGALEIRQDRPVLGLSRARDFLERIGAPEGRFSLHADMPPGGGAGASTAALLALAAASGQRGPALAQACLAVEGASDPLMLPNPDQVLWAPREGRVLAAIPPLPRAEIVGGFWGAPQVTDPADLAFPDVSDLVRRMGRGCALVDLAAIARTSAERCTGARGPAGDPVAGLAQDLGALGYLRAHTGSARGLIFAPGTVPAHAEAALAEAGFRETLRFCTGQRQ